MPRPKKGNEDQLLLLLACGMTQEAAARTLALSERTVRRRLRDPDFCRRLQQLREEMVQRTAAMLLAAGGEAVRTLVALQKEPFPPATRLGAARTVLAMGLRARAAGELEPRPTPRDAAAPAAEQGSIQTPEDALQLIAATIEDLRTGRRDPKTATTLGGLAATWLRSMEVTELAQRLQALQAVLLGRKENKP